MPINKLAPYDATNKVYAAPILIPHFTILDDGFRKLGLHAVTAYIHRELDLPPYVNSRFFAFYSKGASNWFMGPFVEKQIPQDMVMDFKSLIETHLPPSSGASNISVAYDPVLKHPSHVMFVDGVSGQCFLMEYGQARTFFSNREWIRYNPMDLTKPMHYTYEDAELLRNLP